MIRWKRLVAIPILLFVLAVQATAAVSSQGQLDIQSVQYRIKPVPTRDRTNLEIYVRFKTDNANPVKVKLPTDCFGMPELHRFVTSFEPEAGTSITMGESKIDRVVHPAKDSTVTLRYVLSYDPSVMDRYPYAPNTSKNHFHVAGCQWLLHIGDDKQQRPISVEIVGAPKTWRLYSTIDNNAARFETIASYDALTSSAIGGGPFRYSFNVKHRPISVFVHDKFNLSSAEIASSVDRIVRLERQWFADYEQPFYNVVVAPRGGVTAGYAPRNGFVCFVRREITRDELNLLLAHEMFHYWLPNKIKIKQSEEYSDVRYEWFFEGFTDYFARRILLEAGLINLRRYVDLINKGILDLVDNPQRHATYDDLIAADKAGRVDRTYKKLSYYRGALIALNWDSQLRATGKGDLADFIRRLYRLARKSNGEISEQRFFDFSAGCGIDAKGDLERYLMRGEDITVSSAVRIKTYQLGETERFLFDAGFSLEQTRRTGKISDVVADSNAYRAGLRNEMEFVRAENASRFSNSWRADQPLVVIVKVSGQERKIDFFPHGKAVKVPLFHLVQQSKRR